MSRLTNSLKASFAILVVSLSATQANADTWGHIQQMALDIQLKSDQLLGETHHYVHTPNYQQMLRSVAEMRREAAYVYTLSIQHGCLYSMSEHLNHLDAMYHNVEALFDATELESSAGNGHVHGSTRHVKGLLKVIEDCIHHVQSDIANLQRPVYRSPYSSRGGYGCQSGVTSSGYGVQVRTPTYRSHPRSRYGHGGSHSGHSRNRGGIRFGNDRFSFHIGF